MSRVCPTVALKVYDAETYEKEKLDKSLHTLANCALIPLSPDEDTVANHMATVSCLAAVVPSWAAAAFAIKPGRQQSLIAAVPQS